MLTPGTIIQNRYRIIRLLSQGGMGAVYLAQDTRLQNSVALKENMGGNSQQFQHEAQLLARLHHPNLPRVSDHFVEPNHAQYLVMDYIEGQSLDDIVQQRGALPEPQALVWIQQILDAVQYLHTQIPPVIHRDIKPHNIIITSRGKAMLVDFGIARTMMQRQLTGTGARGMGTPGYAPPEQYGGGTTSSSDIYALGGTIYYLLTAQVPLDAPSRAAGSQLTPPRQINPLISKQTEIAVLKALELSSNRRWQSVADFRSALGETPALSSPIIIRNSAKPRTLARRWLVPGCVIVLALLIGILVLSEGNLLSNTFSWAVSNWIWIALVFAVLLAIANRTAIIDGWQKLSQTIRPRQTHQSAPKSSISPQSPLKEDSTPQLPLDHPSKSLKHMEWISHAKKPIIEELILQEDFERLKSFIVESSGGQYVLTGYGRFGGTSIVRGAMARAKRELEQRHQRTGILLSFYFNIKEKKDEAGKFEIEANEFSFGTLTPQTPNPIANSSLNELKEHADRADTAVSGAPALYQFSLATPLRESFFKPGLTGLVPKKDAREQYDLAKLSVELNAFFDSGKKSSDLQRIVLRVLQSHNLPSRVVIILDRIARLETLESLAKFDLFKNERISVIAVARKEDFDGWDKGEQRLNAIGFKKWYVPCLWQTGGDYVQRIDRALLGPSNIENQDIQRTVTLWRKHLEFVGKGALGDVLEELKHPQYWSSDERGSVHLRLDALPHMSTILHNAWMQDMLNLNWDFILAHRFPGDEREDRARIGTYHVVNWITEQQAFTQDEVLDASRNSPIRISNNSSIAGEVVSNLLQVMMQNQYVLLSGQQYRVNWKKDQHPQPRQVKIETEVPRTETPISSAETQKQKENREDSMEHSDPPGDKSSPEDSPPSGFRYDVFISYSHKDEEWVQKYLLPPLEHVGLRVCIDYRNFEIGVPRLENMENAVRFSRKTLLVITPSWLKSELTDFESLLVQTRDPIGRRRSIVPLMVQLCQLPERLEIFTYLDLTDPAQYDKQINRLVATCASGTA